MDFIKNNLVWLIIVGVVLLLAIIGFIAEKNGLVSDEKKEKDSKPEIDKEKIEQNENIQGLVNKETENSEVVSDTVEESETVNEDVNQNVNETVNEVAETPEISEEEIKPVDINKEEDLYAPFGDQVFTNETAEVKEEESEEEDIWKF